MKNPRWFGLVADGVDEVTGEEIDPPRFDGGPVAWGCLIFTGLAIFGIGAILWALV